MEVKLAGCCMEKTVTVGAGCEERLVFAMEFDEVQAWSNAQPALYFLQAVLSVNGEPTDDLIERVGFRTVTLDGSKIMVNGEAVYLKGFNRHEDYASVGCAMGREPCERAFRGKHAKSQLRTAMRGLYPGND